MRISYIIGIIIIGVAIAIIASTAGNASQYVSFKEAYAMAADGSKNQVHVVGKLKKTATGDIVGMMYNPAMDPNYFVFTLIDNAGEEHQVVYHNPKPQDFDKSEQIVVVGAVKGKDFVADQILLKCPSKYEEQEIK